MHKYYLGSQQLPSEQKCDWELLLLLASITIEMVHEKNKVGDFWKPLYFVTDRTMQFRTMGSISPGHTQEAMQCRSMNFTYNEPLLIADFVVASCNRVK